jgi:Mg2+ and Co2+ transporter CorA
MTDKHFLTLGGDIKVVLMEWLPIGHETIKCLQDKLGCLDTQNEFFITGVVDHARNAATIEVEDAEIMLRLDNYDPMESLQFTAKVEIQETGAGQQEEEIGVTVRRTGMLSYGVSLKPRPSERPYCMDDIGYIAADLVEDSSRVMDTIFNAYQKNLLDIIYCQQRNQRDKYFIAMADRLHPDTGDWREWVENSRYKLELQQVIGKIRQRDVFATEDGTVFIVGEDGLFVIGEHGPTYREILLIYSSIASMISLQDNIFSRIAMSWDSLYEQKRRIQDEDVEQILEIQSELSTLSANQSMLQSVPRHMVRAVREVVQKLDAVERDASRVKGANIPFIERITTLFRHHADDWINDGEQALDTLGSEVENVRRQASGLSEKEAFKINSAVNITAIASFVFLPLTLITGIYGMNFMMYAEEGRTKISSSNMPELYWEHGYLFAFGLMALALLLTQVMVWRMGFYRWKRKRKNPHKNG